VRRGVVERAMTVMKWRKGWRGADGEVSRGGGVMEWGRRRKWWECKTLGRGHTRQLEEGMKIRLLRIEILPGIGEMVARRVARVR
jgi:hypothetical protein